MTAGAAPVFKSENRVTLKALEHETIGVILLNLGGPDSLAAIRPFLYNLFSDREIIQLGPRFLQKPLAGLISTLRSKKTEKMYRLIGGGSPIKALTKAQAAALEESLNKRSDSRQFKVYVGMRYWHPLIEDVVPQIYQDGIRKLVALSLYPQYSVATSGSSFSKFKEVAAGYQIETVCAPSWYDHPRYIEALADVIRKGLESFHAETRTADPVHVLFSAHSLPKKIIDAGDPYVDQTLGTIREVTKLMPLTWHLSYQSRSGPVEWLEPSTDKKIEELGLQGVKNILVVPISFVSDHIETLYEIDILYARIAERLGIRLRRTESLNTHPKFIEALEALVQASLRLR